MSTVNEQSKTLKLFTKKIDDLNTKLDNLENKFSKLVAENDQIKNHLDLFEKDFTSLRQKTNYSNIELELVIANQG